MPYVDKYPNYNKDDLINISKIIGIDIKKCFFNYQDIIINFMNDIKIVPCRRIKELSGVTTFTFYPNYLNKKILLLGEIHRTDNLCKSVIGNVNLWFMDLVKTSYQLNQCLDIFLEGSYKVLNDDQFDCKIESYSSPLNSIHASLLYLIKKNPELLNSCRIHLIDIRNISRNNNWINVLFPISRLGIDDTISEILAEHLDRHQICELLLGIDQSDDLINTFIESLLDIQNEYKKTKYDKDVLYNSIKEYFVILNKEFSKTTIIDLKYKLYQYFTYNDDNTFSLILKISMDIYVLSRLFIKFDESKKYGTCKNTISNVIFHMGKAHLETYNHIFGLENATYNMKSDQKLKQCLTFSEPFDFFQ